MKTIKNPIFYFAVALLSGIIFYGCKKDNDGPYGVPVQTGNNITTTISGIVLDESNAPLEGVTVNAYGQTTTTNQFGLFVLQNVSVAKSRCIVNYNKAGYFNRADAFIPTANTVNYVRIVMISDAQTHTINTSTGGTVTLPDGSSVQFPASGFVVAATGAAYNGVVTITFKHLMPGTPNFGFSIPGGDLAAINSSGEDVTLYTFGMIGVELTGSGGEALQLANGKTATITMPVAAMQMPEAKPTIPLWYFDESTSLWMEEGSATLIGNNYVGTVTHFSWWNCDVPADVAIVNGKVVDCNGIALPNFPVMSSNGGCAITDQNGEFNETVPTIASFSIYADNNFFISQTELIPQLVTGQTYVAPDLVVPCGTRVTGRLISCSNSNTHGLVVLTNGTSVISSLYCHSGSFEFLTPVASSLKLWVYRNSIQYYEADITTLGINDTLNIAPISMCEITSIDSTDHNNYIVINGGSFSNDTIHVPVLFNSNAQVDSAGVPLQVQFSGYGTGGYTVQPCNITVQANSPGTYPTPATGGVYIYFQDTIPTNYQILYQSGAGSVTITQVDTVGGRVKGSFTGSATMVTNGLNPIGATYSGKFDILRTY